MDTEVVDTKKCPYCAETIKAEAVLCRYCGHNLAPVDQPAPAQAPVQIITPKAEIVYHQDGGITVTNTRAILNNQTYSMSNVTSVSMQTVPANHTIGIVLLLLSVMAGLCGLSSDQGRLFLFLGLVGVVVGIIILANNHTKYAVRIGSASGEANALVSSNKEHIGQIVEAINKAIVERG